MKTKKNVTKRFCSPKMEKGSTYTCFTMKSLKNMADSINRERRNSIRLSRSKKILWNNIRNYFSRVCNDEWCWIQQEVIKRLRDEDISKNTFRPIMPKEWQDNSREWLSTLDIEDVMKQYEAKYNDFLFIGPVPIDFDSKHQLGGCVVDELCNMDIKKLYKNKKKRLGIVFNLDRHDQPGSHWVALFSNFTDKTVYYYDSYGIGPKKEVTTLMDRIEKQLNTIIKNKKGDKTYNKVRHQFKNSECGVYSMMFIINMLENNNFKKISENVVLDDDIHKNRYRLYSPIKHEHTVV